MVLETFFEWLVMQENTLNGFEWNKLGDNTVKCASVAQYKLQNKHREFEMIGNKKKSEQVFLGPKWGYDNVYQFIFNQCNLSLFS